MNVSDGDYGLPVTVQEKGSLMGKEARMALVLAASACLLAVMVDWAVMEMQEHEPAQHRS